jgi:hypothetical protein
MMILGSEVSPAEREPPECGISLENESSNLSTRLALVRRFGDASVGDVERAEGGVG